MRLETARLELLQCPSTRCEGQRPRVAGEKRRLGWVNPVKRQKHFVV
jgi:hypothetical protein